MNLPPVRRLVALFAALALGFTGVVFRLTVLQVREADAYSDLALSQRLREVPLPASRGAIRDRHGEDLALSLDAAAVYADPRFVKDSVGTARRIARILGRSRKELRRALEGATGSFVYLARQVDLRLARQVEELGLPGIGLLRESRRSYPSGEMMAPQVIGFTGVDGQGLNGLEYQYDAILAGTGGERVVEIDPYGRVIPQGVDHEVPPVPGDDLVLTIDKNLQYRTQQALKEYVRLNGAKRGTVVVMDPRTGEVLAMATYPWFDPNRWEDLTPRQLANRARNRAVTDVYEPGSVNKAITAAAVLQERLVSPRERFSVPDHYTIGDKEFHDAESHPTEQMTLGDIIAHSSNVGTIEVADRLGPERLAQYLARFGEGQETGVGFPGESEGLVPALYRWWDTSMGTIPIGQGVAVTPLQMASVYATIANGGMWVQPSLVRGVIDPQGTFHPALPPATRRAVSERTARMVTRMLTYAVQDGTGTRAEIEGYSLAGKTGTARKSLTYRAGYSQTRYVASFVGFLPASDPRVVIGVMLDEPRTVFGGIASAPLFRAVALQAIARLRIPPGTAPALPPHALPTS